MSFNLLRGMDILAQIKILFDIFGEMNNEIGFKM